jgi:hypothetical protein
MNLRLLAGVGLAVTLAPAIVVAQQSSGDPAANWAAITGCASLQGAEARHQCMDGVLRRNGVLSEARVVQETREDFGIDRREVQARAVATPPPARAAAAPGPPVPAAPEIDEITTAIAAVSDVGYQRIRVTTAEGSVWDQTQARTFTSAPRVGDAFVIERSPLSGYRCRFGRSSLYRCDRIK